MPVDMCSRYPNNSLDTGTYEVRNSGRDGIHFSANKKAEHLNNAGQKDGPWAGMMVPRSMFLPSKMKWAEPGQEMGNLQAEEFLWQKNLGQKNAA